MRIPCHKCRHLVGVGFDAPTPHELALLDRLKVAHGALARGRALAIGPGLLATLYSGWALERRPAPGSALRAARILLPGDMIGLGGATGEIVAATDITFCRFEPGGVAETAPGPLGARLLRVALRQAAEAEAALAATRALPAVGRTAWLVRALHARLARRKLARDGTFLMPVARRDFAELLGLTPVHLRRSCAALLAGGAARFERERVTILDPARLDALAGGVAADEEGAGARTLF